MMRGPVDRKGSSFAHSCNKARWGPRGAQLQCLTHKPELKATLPTYSYRSCRSPDPAHPQLAALPWRGCLNTKPNPNARLNPHLVEAVGDQVQRVRGGPPGHGAAA